MGTAGHWLLEIPTCVWITLPESIPAFQILLRNRATDLDARMHDGTTPLILAARLAVEGMLEDLINSHADVNAVDDLGRPKLRPSSRGHQPLRGLVRPNLLSPLLAFFPGKSALHWAAAVNNVDAAVVLLKNGANKDMQNNKVSEGAALAAGACWGSVHSYVGHLEC